MNGPFRKAELRVGRTMAFSEAEVYANGCTNATPGWRYGGDLGLSSFAFRELRRGLPSQVLEQRIEKN